MAGVSLKPSKPGKAIRSPSPAVRDVVPPEDPPLLPLEETSSPPKQEEDEYEDATAPFRPATSPPQPFDEDEYEAATAPIKRPVVQERAPVVDPDEYEAATAPVKRPASGDDSRAQVVLLDDDDDEFEAATAPTKRNDPQEAQSRMRLAQAAVTELDNVVGLEIQYGSASQNLSIEEQNERAFRKLALFGTRAERVVQERKAEADKIAAQRKAEAAAVRVVEENNMKTRDQQKQEYARLEYQRQKKDELDIELRPLPAGWETKVYNLPVAPQEYWAVAENVYFCGDCKKQLKTAPTDPLGRHRCMTCGQIYCSFCCPLVGYSSQNKDLGKFRACAVCVQTTLAVAAKLKSKTDKNDQLRRVIAEKSEQQGQDHCLVVGCKENHRQHYCKYCKAKDANHFSSSCPKAPKTKK